MIMENSARSWEPGQDPVGPTATVFSFYVMLPLLDLIIFLYN